MEPSKDPKEPTPPPGFSVKHTPHQPQTGRFTRFGKFKWRSLTSNLLLGALLVFIFTGTFKPAFLIQSYLVDGQSMAPTLQNNDRLIINKLPQTVASFTKNPYIPQRGDIIIFSQSGLSFGSNQEKQLIKRVIGLPGERVVINNGAITLYNREHPSGYNPDKSGLYNIAAPATPGNVDITLKANEIFVCGDNRSNSEDSRYFGPITVDKILGKLVLRILPINKADRF
ncbi:signal peptidase I [Candidatus Saccharibacteria bacterium]|nr:signal peptidase I [Candidatus Saccharibacteria bacterium]